MGASEEYNEPILLCFFETGNEEQKKYCFKLKDNYSYEESIKYEIKTQPGAKFKISFRLYGKTYLIQDIFDDSDEALNESLEKIYALLKKGASKKKYPELLCVFEPGNQEQKQYCIKLKDNFRYEEPIKFKIDSQSGSKFKISFKLKGKTYLIQDIFDDSDKALNESLEKMYSLLEKEPRKKKEKEKEKKYKYPVLLCDFEIDKEEQKLYCIKLKENFCHEKSIQFEIKSKPYTKFKISFRLLNGKTYVIQDIFDDSDEALNESLEKMYTLLDGGDILEKSNENKNDKSIETEQNKNQVITIFFESTDKKINYELNCNKDSVFKDIEEKLNQEFVELRNVKKIYLYNGSQIDINKTFEENKIENNSHIIIAINDIPSVNDE